MPEGEVQIPALGDLPAPVRRIILHWTAGRGSASEYDRQHYHYIVQRDGSVVEGVPVEANMRRCGPEAPYAAHTAGLNSYSVGVAYAGMYMATPDDLGPEALTEDQVEAGMRFVARLCRAWGLAPLPEQLFTHSEAERLHGIRQAGKWDIDVLGFRPELGPEEVGPYLRARVREHLQVLAALDAA